MTGQQAGNIIRANGVRVGPDEFRLGSTNLQEPVLEIVRNAYGAPGTSVKSRYKIDLDRFLAEAYANLPDYLEEID